MGSSRDPLLEMDLCWRHCWKDCRNNAWKALDDCDFCMKDLRAQIQRCLQYDRAQAVPAHQLTCSNSFSSSISPLMSLSAHFEYHF